MHLTAIHLQGYDFAVRERHPEAEFKSISPHRAIDELLRVQLLARVWLVSELSTMSKWNGACTETLPRAMRPLFLDGQRAARSIRHPAPIG